MTYMELTHIGGHPLIDFINTEMTPNGKKVDLLTDNDALIYWLQDIGMISADELQYSWAEDKTLLSKARNFRQQMRTIVAAIVKEEPIAPDLVDNINEALQHWHGRLQLQQDEQAFRQEVAFAIENSAQLLAVIADTAVNFLTTIDLRYIKQCSNHECIRYFIDTSKNHSRRWCSMDGCGNRMKARAHYARQK